jgi:hypothetical protein
MQVERELFGVVTVDGVAQRRPRIPRWLVAHWRLS